MNFKAKYTDLSFILLKHPIFYCNHFKREMETIWIHNVKENQWRYFIKCSLTSINYTKHVTPLSHWTESEFTAVFTKYILRTRIHTNRLERTLDTNNVNLTTFVDHKCTSQSSLSHSTITLMILCLLER